MIKGILISGILLLLIGRTEAQFRYGLTAGFLQSRISVDSEYEQYEYRDIILRTNQGRLPGYGSSDRTHIAGASSSATSWYGGFVFDYFFTDGLAIRWKLLLQNPGWKGQFVKTGNALANYPLIPTSRADTVTGNDQYSLQYITLPVDIVFFASLKKARLYFGAGGYLAYGVAGHYKVSITHSTFSEVRDSVAEISFNPNTDQYRAAPYHAHRVDIGLTACAGIEFRNGLFIDMNYSVGLKDILIDRYGFQNTYGRDYDIVLPNRIRIFSVGLGYFITRKRS